MAFQGHIVVAIAVLERWAHVVLEKWAFAVWRGGPLMRGENKCKCTDHPLRPKKLAAAERWPLVEI